MNHRVAGRQKRALQTREAILGVARALFAAHGFDAVKLETIAAEAGLAKGSVLAHFSEKLVLLAVIFGDSLALAAVELRLAPAPLRSERLAEILWPLVGNLLSDPAYLRLLTAEPQTPSATQLRPDLERFTLALEDALDRTGHDHADIAATMVRAVLLQLTIEARDCRLRDGRTLASIAARRRLASLLAFALRDPL